MNSLPKNSSGQITESSQAAADWVVRGQSHRLSRREERELAAWLAESEENFISYHEALMAYEITGAVAPHPELMAMRKNALAYQPQKARRPMIGAFAFLIAASILAGGVFVAPIWKNERSGVSQVELASPAGQGSFSTNVGERLTTVLKDGTEITLNTNSKINVAYTDQSRKIEILRGQALFKVAHNRDWPFEVLAKDKVIRALGTVFDVNMAKDNLEVILVEGKVKVDDRQASDSGVAASSVELAAGEKVVVTNGVTRVSTVDVVKALGWKEGRIIFSGTQLSDAIEEINRYRRDPILYTDPKIGNLSISGGYRVADAARFEYTLMDTFDQITIDRSRSQTMLMWREGNTFK